MKKASEYRVHAQECRTLALQMDSAEQRDQMLQMADHWEKLALDRTSLLHNHPELDEADVGEEPVRRGPSRPAGASAHRPA